MSILLDLIMFNFAVSVYACDLHVHSLETIKVHFCLRICVFSEHCSLMGSFEEQLTCGESESAETHTLQEIIKLVQCRLGCSLLAVLAAHMSVH